MTLNLNTLSPFLTKVANRKEAEAIAAVETRALGRQVWVLRAKGFYFVVQLPLAKQLALSGKFDYVA